MKTETIQITHELLALLSEIDELKGAWRALGTLAPERLNGRALNRACAGRNDGPRKASPHPTALRRDPA
jgi:hypothetical protein